MTPLQKKNNGRIAIYGCLFFYFMYFYITKEPKFYPDTNIPYHDYCDRYRIMCPYCIWWFIAMGTALTLCIFSLMRNYQKDAPEERKLHFLFEFCALFMGNWLIDLYQKIKHPEMDCIELQGNQVAYTIFCIFMTIYRYNPDRFKKVIKSIRNAILYIVLLKFARDLFFRRSVKK